VYSHVYDRLDDQKLYSLFMIRRFAMDEQLLIPGSDDGPNFDLKLVEERFRCALVRANNPNYTGRRLPAPDGSVKDRGRINDAWYGATVKLFLVDQWSKERARLEKLRNKLLIKQRAGRIPAWPKRTRVWMAVAVFAAVAGAAPPVRDVMGIMLNEGVAAARELAYSVSPRTPEALFQQAWLDYRSGEYESAAKKAHEILSEDHLSDHLKANGLYLLGSVDWETGSSVAALPNFRKAYLLYESGGDVSNMYQTTIAMVRADLALGDLDAAGENLQTALTIYDADGGKHIPHLGEYHAVGTRLAAARHDWQTALAHAKRRNAIYQREPLQLDMVAAAKSELGFWFAANGCSEQAQRLTVEAGRIIFRLHDETRHVYNELNWLLIYRLQGFRSDSGAVGSIKEWAKIRGDTRVEELLDLALSLEPTKEYADDLCFEDSDPE